jgi:hypothetical protein
VLLALFADLARNAGWVLAGFDGLITRPLLQRTPAHTQIICHMVVRHDA